MKFGLKPLFFIGLLWLTTSAWGQQIQLQLGPDEIGENQGWTIAITVVNEQLKSYGNFPEIN